MTRATATDVTKAAPRLKNSSRPYQNELRAMVRVLPEEPPGPLRSVFIEYPGGTSVSPTWRRHSCRDCSPPMSAGEFDVLPKCLDTSVETAGKSACATSARQSFHAFRWAPAHGDR